MLESFCQRCEIQESKPRPGNESFSLSGGRFPFLISINFQPATAEGAGGRINRPCDYVVSHDGLGEQLKSGRGRERVSCLSTSVLERLGQRWFYPGFP
jgi:hypothetical protein